MPRISAFARLANGNVAPDRIIEGQDTSLSRTMHGLAYDPVNDEIIVPVALSGAILVFRGGAVGNEPPVRVIQGSQTGLIRPHTANVDPESGEILAGDPSARGVLVFDRLANGNAKPKRVISGPRTQFREIVGVASDTKNNAIVVASRAPGGPSGIFVFNRLDAGGRSAEADHHGADDRRPRALQTVVGRSGARQDLSCGSVVPRAGTDAAEGGGSLHE